MLLIFIILLTILWVIYSQIIAFPLPDFLEYWASGRLNATGGNPYDPVQMIDIERTVGWKKDQTLMMLNPPWVLSYAMLFGIFSYPISRFLCFVIQMGMICACAIALWKIYNWKKRDEWISWIVVLTFAPILQALKSGQVTILVVTGIVGFLYLIRKESDFWAGVFASLILFKPQLLYLFLLALFFWSITRRRYYVIAGIAISLLASLGLAWIFNPRIFSQYIYMLNNYPIQNWMTSTLGTYLRFILDPDIFYIQFIPSIIGVIGFIFYWNKHKKSFDWTNDLPRIILISLATTPYGWTHDVAVGVIGVLQIALLIDFKHWTINKVLILSTYWIVNLAIMFLRISQYLFWWYPGFLLLWYYLSYYYLSSNKTELDKSEFSNIAQYG